MRYAIAILTALGICLSGWSLSIYLNLYENFAASARNLDLPLFTAGILLIVLGHVVRAGNWGTLFSKGDGISFRSSLTALCVGGLYNGIMPFRIGEIVRAFAIRRLCSVSFLYALTVILIERAVDSLILGLTGLTVGYLTGVQSTFWFGLYGALVLISFGAAALLFTIRELPLWLRLIVKNTTAYFRDDIRNKIRFSIWSLSHGLHSRVNRSSLYRFSGISFVVWTCYLGGASLVIYSSLPAASPLSSAIYSAPNSFAASVLPSGPGYIGTYQLAFVRLSSPLFDTAALPWLALTTWFTITVPLVIAGLVFVLFYRKNFSRARTSKHNAANDTVYFDARLNKLSRKVDVSPEFERLLETFFSGNSIWDLVHRAEYRGSFRSLQTFKGGSTAVSLLVYRDDKPVVAKITSISHADKLRAQGEWFLSRADTSALPNVIGDELADNYYTLYLEYLEEYISLHRFVHTAGFDSAWTVVKSVINFVRETIHSEPLPEPINKLAVVEDYITTKVLLKLRDAAHLSPQLNKLLQYETLIVNGRTCPNLARSISMISATPEVLKDLADYRACQLHGDLTIENVLVHPRSFDFKLIDPNNENTLSAATLDYGKLYQSLHSGYEFLCELGSILVNENEVRFDELKSDIYHRLFDQLQSMLAKSLSPAQLNSVLFHEAVHYTRMLTYRAAINPSTVCAFYAVATRLFDDFLGYYEISTSQHFDRDTRWGES